MATRTKKTPAPKAETAEIAWSYGVRTWSKDGTSHGGFRWDLTPGARTEAPDWQARPECGRGLHANKDGWGDWSLLGLDASGAGKIIGIIRWDSALEIAIDYGEKHKFPWAEVVMTSRDASIASIYNFISDKWRERMAASGSGLNSSSAMFECTRRPPNRY